MQLKGIKSYRMSFAICVPAEIFFVGENILIATSLLLVG
jgi:hypothetical protein